MCVIDEGERAAFTSETFPRATRAYHCYDCNQDIAPGERYRRFSGKWDGRLDVYKHCIACSELAEAVTDVDCSYLFGTLLDDARQAISPDGDHWSAPPEKMGRLIGLVFRETERRAA